MGVIKNKMRQIFTSEVSPGNMDIPQTGFKYCNIRNFTQYAQNYLKVGEAELLKRLVKKRKRNSDKQVVVLDLMCGVGNAVKQLNQIEGVTAYGIDNLSYKTWRENPDQFVQANVEDLSFIKTGSIDFIFNVIGFFDYCQDWKGAFRESLRVLSRRGQGLYHPYYPEYLQTLSLRERIFQYRSKILKGNLIDGLEVNRSLEIKRK